MDITNTKAFQAAFVKIEKLSTDLKVHEIGSFFGRFISPFSLFFLKNSGFTPNSIPVITNLAQSI